MLPVTELVKIIHGSHLYGTSTPASDLDYKAIDETIIIDHKTTAPRSLGDYSDRMIFADYAETELRIMATMPYWNFNDLPPTPAEEQDAMARRKRGKPTFKDRAHESAEAKKAMIERAMKKRKRAK